MSENEMRQMFIDVALYEYFKMFMNQEFDETNVCTMECISKNGEYEINIDIQIKKVLKE